MIAGGKLNPFNILYILLDMHILAPSSVHKYKAPDSSPSPIIIINQILFIFIFFSFLQSAVCMWFCAGLAVYGPYVNPLKRQILQEEKKSNTSFKITVYNFSSLHADCCNYRPTLTYF